MLTEKKKRKNNEILIICVLFVVSTVWECVEHSYIDDMLKTQ
jgi:hypothetical protein